MEEEQRLKELEEELKDLQKLIHKTEEILADPYSKKNPLYKVQKKNLKHLKWAENKLKKMTKTQGQKLSGYKSLWQKIFK